LGIQKSKARRNYILLALLCGLVLAILVPTSVTFQKCVADFPNNKGAQNLELAVPRFFVAPARYISLSIICTGRFIERKQGLVTALASIIVAWFTVTLATATADLRDAADQQKIDTRKSLEIAAKAADAADLNARAALRLQMPVIKYVVPELVAMNRPEEAGRGGTIWNAAPTRYSRITQIQAINIGVAPAYPVELALGWRVVATLPENPTYRFKTASAPSTVLRTDKPVRQELDTHCIELTDGELAQTKDGTAHLWVYGCLFYTDFMGDPHEAHVCWRWERLFGRFGFVRTGAAPKAYNLNT